MNKINIFLYNIIIVFILQASSAFAQTSLREEPIKIDLNKAMDLAESYSLSVKIKQSEEDNAQQQNFFSILQLSPSVTASGTMNFFDQNHAFTNVNNHGEGINSTNLSFTASEAITGLILSPLKIGQTSALLRAKTQDILTAKINARFEGAKAYILVQKLLRTLAAKQAATKFAIENCKQTQILFDTGSIEKTKIDLLQTKAEAATARLEEISIKKDLHSALVDLGIKIGMQDIDLTQIKLDNISAWEKIKPTLPNLSSALSQAFAQRPEIKSAEENINAAKLKLSQAYLNYLPQVNLFASYSKNINNYPAADQNLQINQFLYGLSLNWNIWDSGIQATQISDNVYERSNAYFTHEKIKQDIIQDVKNSLNNLYAAISTLNDAKEAAESYEAAFKLAAIQYKTGDYSAINLIATQNKMTAAQVDLANIRSELDLSWIKLQAALGQLPKIIL